jgi:hypothetical protein
VPRAPLALRVWTGLSVGIVLDVDEVSPPPTHEYTCYVRPPLAAAAALPLVPWLHWL